MKWTEGHVHVAMRRILRDRGWLLIAGEYPGGSDHELYPLNVVDPALARDLSPDPRRHSLGEIIPDLVALKGRRLILAEAKVSFDLDDQIKLQKLLSERRPDLLSALRKFATDRRVSALLPIETIEFHPTLVFTGFSNTPPPPPGFTFLRVLEAKKGIFEGGLKDE
jgi:hypothetical protein